MSGEPKQVTVAHILPWSGVGGVEVATLRLVEASRHLYRHVAFVTPEAQELRGRFEELGIPVLTYVAPTPSLRHFVRFWRESRKMAVLLREQKVDLVHLSDTKAAEHASLAAWQARTKLLCHVRNMMPSIPWREKLWMRPVDLFVFVSEHAQRTFGMSTGLAGSRVLYDAIDPPGFAVEETRAEVREELGIGAARPVVAMVARVAPQKDHRTLGEAARTVLQRHPETVFLIIGDNGLIELNRKHYAKVAARLRELGIEQSFLFTGHRQDALRLAAAADLCVLVTHREGFPLSLLETMVLEKPTIATRVGGIPEIVIPGETGFLHEHEDAAELARHILRLLDDPVERRELGKAGAARVRELHTLPGFVRELDHAYRLVLK